MIRILRDLIRLIEDMLRQARYEDTFRGLYMQGKTPKTFGTRIGGKDDTH